LIEPISNDTFNANAHHDEYRVAVRLRTEARKKEAFLSPYYWNEI
jgi:hypothetical protein